MTHASVAATVAYVAALTAAVLGAYGLVYGADYVLVTLRNHSAMHFIVLVGLVSAVGLDGTTRRDARLPNRRDLLLALRTTFVGVAPVGGLGACIAVHAGDGDADWRILVFALVAWIFVNPVSMLFVSAFGFRPLVPSTSTKPSTRAVRDLHPAPIAPKPR